MGYRSDVVLAVALNDRAQLDEVLAIYQMHPSVQKHDLVKEWAVRDWGGVWGMTYTAEYVKWYEDYEYVKGLEHMLEVVQTFGVERGEKFPFAYYKIRIGEDLEDVHTEADGNDGDLESALYGRMSVNRSIETDF